MKIKLLVSRSGADGAQNVGDIIDVTDGEAVRMIEAGQAEAIRSAPKPENTMRNAKSEKATR